ncbi:MAG: hypothetical protein GY805_23230 [Chloroflexi bacterium]|nr:hypothetical protein [Chloroflexota bacterium]
MSGVGEGTELEQFSLLAKKICTDDIDAYEDSHLFLQLIAAHKTVEPEGE